MIHPLLGMTFRGIVYHQGEQDVWHPEYYRCMFPALIRSRQKQFTQVVNVEYGTLPFGFVQLQG